MLTGPPGSRTLSVRRLVGIAALLLVVVVGIAAVATVAGALSLSHSRHRQTDALDPASTGLSRLFNDYLDEETGVRGYVITGEATFLQPYTMAERRIGVNATLLRRDAASIPGASAQLDAVLAAQQAWSTTYAEPTLADMRTGDETQARSAAFQTQGNDLFGSLRTTVQTLNTTISAAVQANQHQTNARESRLWLLLGASLLVLLGGTLAALLLVRRLIVSPLEALRERVRAVASHGFDQPIAATGPAEIVDVAADVEAMRGRLVEEIDRSRRAAEALVQEGPAVTALRRALNPRVAPLPWTEITGRLVPAAGLLAGDWFDVLALEEGRVGLVVGDVSGHGADAGVYALELKHLITNTLRAGLPPGEALGVTARQMTAPAEVFATVFVTIIDPTSDTLIYANAGHPDGLLVPGGAADPVADEEASPALVDLSDGHHDPAKGTPVALSATGPLLSEIVAGSTWATRQLPLRPGDTIIVITDGIVEARDQAGAEFGKARLVELCRSFGDATVGSSAESILIAVAEFSGDRQPDDRTVLVCRRTAVGPGDGGDGPEPLVAQAAEAQR